MNRLIKCLVSVILVLSIVCPVCAEESAYDVMVTVNGESLYRYEVNSLSQTILQAMIGDGYDAEEEALADAVWQAAVEQLVDDRLLVQDMTAAGCYDLTEEETEQLTQVSKTACEAMLQQYTIYFSQQTEDMEEAQEQAAAYLLSAGYTEEAYYSYYCNNFASARYIELLMQGETPQTDEELYAEQMDAKIDERLEQLRAQAEIVYAQ